jgi:Zn-finger nucleic acid-binding protein
VPDTRLVRCDTCNRVYDSSGWHDGDTFPCHCGSTIAVREVRAHDSPVIRCSSCGGARDANATACTFCRAPFTVLERDLASMCAGCGARAARGDNYCRACGQMLVRAEHAGTPGHKICPVCDGGQRLTNHVLTDVAVLECQRCAGVWVDRGSFSIMASRAAKEAVTDGFAKARGTPRGVRHQTGPAYRRCVECDAVMQRKNYGAKSGVIVDICARHGIWFDALELDEVLAWLMNGGQMMPEPAAAKVDEVQARAIVAAASQSPTVTSGPASVAGDILVEVIELFFRSL